MKRVLLLSSLLIGFNGHSASESAATGCGAFSARAVPKTTTTRSAISFDERHTVKFQEVSDPLEFSAASTGLGRSSDQYTHILPAFKQEATLLDPTTGGHLLDLGCGRAGHIAQIFNSRSGPLTYTAVDLDTTEAKTTFSEVPLTNPLTDSDHLNFVSAGVLDYLPTVAPHSIDAIWSGHLIHFLSPVELIKFYREAHRVLKPEGRFYYTWADFNASRVPQVSDIYEGKIAYASTSVTLWPGFNITGTTRKQMINDYLMRNFSEKNLQKEISQILAGIFPGSPSKGLKESSANFVKQIAELATRPNANVLKPMEMKPLVEACGFEVTAGYPEHYIDRDSAGTCNTYYGFIATKPADKKEDIRALLPYLKEATALEKSLRAALPKDASPQEILRSYIEGMIPPALRGK